MGDSETGGRLAAESDERLFARVRKGDEPTTARDALGVLFERYHARVLLSCERILGAGPAAEDAMQEIFLALLDSRKSYENRATFGAWLFVLTRNHCLNLLRRHRREIDVDPYEAFVTHPSNAPDPERWTHERELGRAIERACEERLNPMEQRVIDLRLKWNLPVKEIDRILGLENASGARTYLSTARRKLREALAQHMPPIADEPGATS